MKGIEMSDSEIHAAMAAAFAEMPEVNLDGKNPHFNSRYATLGNIVHKIRPVLAKHGLYFVQCVDHDGQGRQGVRTIIGHKSGGRIDAGLAVVSPRKDDAHGQGSALTYAKRYGLCAALGIVDEQDDDGNGAVAGENASANGHGRPVKNAPTTGAGDFFRAILAKTSGEMNEEGSQAVARKVTERLGINPKNATPAQWKSAIDTVNQHKDLVAWANGGDA